MAVSLPVMAVSLPVMAVSLPVMAVSAPAASPGGRLAFSEAFTADSKDAQRLQVQCAQNGSGRPLGSGRPDLEAV